MEYFGINGERRDEELVFCDFTCKPMYIKMLYVFERKAPKPDDNQKTERS